MQRHAEHNRRALRRPVGRGLDATAPENIGRGSGWRFGGDLIDSLDTVGHEVAGAFCEALFVAGSVGVQTVTLRLIRA